MAFSGQYDGNVDVYTVSVEGGAPTRLTWHPAVDSVQDWHPDGRRVLFSSRRASNAPVRKLFHASIDGGTPEALVVPKVNHASYDATGGRLAYTPFRDAFRSWKRHRGGTTARIWIFDVETHDVEEIPHENASDTFPRWLDGAVYFASDRDGRMNLHRYRPGSGEVEQLTAFREFDVRNVGTGGGVVVFEQAGAVHLFDPRAGAVQRLVIHARDDGLAARAHWQKVDDSVRGADLAPNGKRAIIEARGEILTLPREHGDARNLTRTPGVHERSPTWSHDGERVAYFSDEGGEYHLVVRDRLGREDPERFELGDGGFYYAPSWSPDDEHILFSDKHNRLAYLTVESGAVTEVARVDGSLGEVRPTAVWSPDSRWIAYEDRNPRTLYDRIALFELASGESTTITDEFGAATEPAFSRDGTQLFFYATVESGPKLFGLDMSTSAARSFDGNLYVAVLDDEGENPLAPRSDEAVDEKEDEDDEDEEDDAEEDDAEEDEGEGEEDAGDTDAPPEDADAPSADADANDEDAEEEDEDEDEVDPIEVDLDGIDQRILALPVDAGRYYGLSCTQKALLFVAVDDGKRKLMAYDFEKREAKSIVEDVNGFAVSSDGKSLLLVKKGNRWSITKSDGKDGKDLKLAAVKVHVDPAREWPQTLREVWRIQRDYFYDENMHGVDWPAMWERWSGFLPHIKHRADLNVVIAELIGELACGHQYNGGGDQPKAPEGVRAGLLGADYGIDQGRYRIERIYRGQNWNPSLRAPLTAPGVDVQVGDYLIAVDGRDVRATDNLFAAFEHTAGRQVELTVAASADGAEPRTSTVVPIASESNLRRREWIEGNRRRVDVLSGGRLAYIYMPNTAGAGQAAFDRDFYSQLDKQGVILDERYNGGGQVADYVIDVLSRKTMSFWMNRERWVGRSPFGTIEGPKVMIVNESAGSGGDWMPWTFKNRAIGPLVGTRTWGGLVGISGYPPLMDGGFVTAASFGVMDPDGNWAVENVGVAPDHEVIEWPAEVIAGGDPQLEKAVALALEELERNPPKPLPTYHPPIER